MKLPMDGPLLLAAVQNKLSNDFVKELRDVLEADKKQQRETHDKRVKKLGDALKKAQAAKHKSLFSKIFGWVAAAVTAIVGAVLTVLAPPLGVAILISAAVAITVQALQQTGELQKFAKVMGKAMKGMFDAFGVKAPWDEKAGRNLCASSDCCGRDCGGCRDDGGHGWCDGRKDGDGFGAQDYKDNQGHCTDYAICGNSGVDGSWCFRFGGSIPLLDGRGGRLEDGGSFVVPQCAGYDCFRCDSGELSSGVGHVSEHG